METRNIHASSTIQLSAGDMFRDELLQDYVEPILLRDSNSAWACIRYVVQ